MQEDHPSFGKIVEKYNVDRMKYRALLGMQIATSDETVGFKCEIVCLLNNYNVLKVFDIKDLNPDINRGISFKNSNLT